MEQLRINIIRTYSTPLFEAAKNGHVRVVESLVRAGADKYIADPRSHHTPLLIACLNGHEQVVDLPLASGADASVKANFSVFFQDALSKGDRFKRALELLLKAATNKEMLLLEATQSRYIDGVEFFLNAGANPNKPDLSGSPLCSASRLGYVEVIELLLQAGADPNIEDCVVFNRGRTPLSCVVGRDFCGLRETAVRLKIVELLLKAGAKRDKADGNGYTPLYLAAEDGFVEVVELLLKADVDKNKGTKYGETPLRAASRAGHAPIVELLLAAGADTKSNEGRELAEAAENGHKCVVELLLNAGLDPKKVIVSSSRKGP